MNISALTAKEVMRICQPETELERRLFEINAELQGEAEDAKEAADQLSNELENSISQEYHHELMDEIKAKVDLALKEIDCGRIDKAKERLESAR
jgi:hypothetical protein